MKTNFSGKKIANSKALVISVLLVVAAIAFSGCGDGYYVTGYGASYYAPDYGPYYADYSYDGAPYWGAGGYYDADIIVRGAHHRRYYGGHHFVHDWRGGGGPRGSARSFSRPPAPHPAPEAGGRHG